MILIYFQSTMMILVQLQIDNHYFIQKGRVKKKCLMRIYDYFNLNKF